MPLVKLFLIVAVLTIMGLSLSGCLWIVIDDGTTTTGTVKIVINNDYKAYEVYMDGAFLGEIPEAPTSWGYTNEKTFYDIPTGTHSFSVKSIDLVYEGSKTKTIVPGLNTVEIYVKYIHK